MVSTALVVLIAALTLLLDVYVYQPVRVISQRWNRYTRLLVRGSYWLVSGFLMLTLMVFLTLGTDYWGLSVRNWLIAGMLVVYLSKIGGSLFVLADDLRRAIKWAGWHIKPGSGQMVNEKKISRSEFLAKAAVLTAAIPFGTLSFGMLSGAYDYRLHKVTVKLPHLPQAFDGLRIGQISDIHAGTLFNKTAVTGGVDLLMSQKPDLLFFTGDLVNHQTDEVEEYLAIFSRLKAPLGVYSVTGNHDYGNYRSWPSQAAKRKNFEDLLTAHRIMGFDLLMNEHRMIEVDGERLAIIGVENWGMGRFTKYGKLEAAWAGTDGAPVKLLLSHDPSHWDAIIRPDFSDIDITFSGHTHGFQFGVEWGSLRWSPSQYVYKQWAGLYRQGSQYLYVNRGFGSIGYPGRIGILPELTVIELKRA